MIMKTDFILIDDDPVFNFLHEKIVGACPCSRQVVAYESPTEALNQIKGLADSGELSGVIFLDVKMPVMNGFQFLAQLEKISLDKVKNAHVYMLTSSMDEGDRIKAKSYSVVKGFLNKPLTDDMMAKLCASVA
jgi:CheY-like chemotaxis protein